MKKKTPGTLLCLCSKCANEYYSSSEYQIYRSDPLQVIMDECLLCRKNRGFDYILRVTPKKTATRLRIIGDVYV